MAYQTILTLSISWRETFSNWIVFTRINKYGEVAMIQISIVFRPIYLSKGPLKRDFLDIYLTAFYGFHKFKNPSVMRVIIFFLKMFKIISRFRKNGEKIFRFWDNCIWKCCNELPLLRRDYLSWAINGLTNSL